MSKLLPLHKVAKILGFQNEGELLLILRLTPNLPYVTRKGVVMADPDELADAMARHGIAVPGDFSPGEEDDGDQDEHEGDDDDEADDAPVRRSRR